jgi:hypothetical protein
VLALGVATLASDQQAREPEPIPAGVAPPPGVYAPGIDIQHYEVEIGLGQGATTFAGRVTLDVRATTDAPTLPLDLTGLAVTSVDGQAAPYDYANGKLRVELPAARTGGTTEVSVKDRPH